MITTVLDFLFIFNISLSKATEARIEQQLQTLASLYLHPFEMVMLLRKPDRKRMRLYEDPEVYLLCPFETTSEDLEMAGFSRGIIEQTDFQYDAEAGRFSIGKDVSELLDMFQGTETLLFVELPND